MSEVLLSSDSPLLGLDEFVKRLTGLMTTKGLSSDDVFARHICPIEQRSRTVAPTSSRGGLVLA